MGWFGMLIVLIGFGFLAMIGIKCWPIIFNEIKIQRAVKVIASDASINKESPDAITKALYKFWAVEDIQYLDAKLVKMTTTDKGKVLAYDYWAQTNVYQNAFVSFHYVHEEPIKSGGE